MIIYVPNITPRISFTMDLIFGKLLGTAYTLTQDLNELFAYSYTKIAYSPEPIVATDVIWIEATQLLFEEGVKYQPIHLIEWNGYNLFFPTNQGAFNFDIFAVSFFLSTRYEEYYPDVKLDKHQRFPVTESTSFKLGFHRKPMINILSLALAQKIQTIYPDFQFTLPNWKSMTTYDVDIAYKFKGKSVYRWLGSFIKALIKTDFGSIKNLFLAVFSQEHFDSFNRFHLHKELAMIENSKPIHFVLTAPLSKFDKNIDPNSKSFQELIEELTQFSEIGLHPSYNSSINNSIISKEKLLLEKKCGFKINKSRQHFLKFKFPSTFEALIEAGFDEDYSLGWHDEAGFRTSTTIPIPFFNLITNKTRPLMLYPLTAMDGALYHCTSSLEECKLVVESLKQEVKKYGGTFIILYHNNSEKHLF